MPETKVAARRRLLDAAGRLFARHGIRGVGIDAVINEAGVAKATLYAHFPSKGHLVAAYLDDQSSRWLAALRTTVDGHDDPASAVGEIFSMLGAWFASPDFDGCLWANARAEQLDEPVIDEALARHRAEHRALFTELAPDHVDALMVLYDGAIATARIDRTPGSAAVAGAIATGLLGAGPTGGRRG